MESNEELSSKGQFNFSYLVSNETVMCSPVTFTKTTMNEKQSCLFQERKLQVIISEPTYDIVYLLFRKSVSGNNYIYQ